MGANVYYWEGETMDIAMLTDVPIARQKFRPDFIRPYIFDVRKPTFMHIRDGWASRSKIPFFPEFRETYIYLPEWRPRGQWKRDLGDYVRLDVFRTPLAGAGLPATPVRTFDSGLSLRDVKVPYEAWMPGRTVALRLVWTTENNDVPDLDFRLHVHTGDGGGTFHHSWKPVHGWYDTTRWETGYVYEEVVRFRIPKDVPPGDYGVDFSFAGRTGQPSESAPDLVSVRIDRDRALAAAKETIDGLEGRPDPIAAYEDYRQALRQAGEARVDPKHKIYRALLTRIERYAVETARGHLDAGRTDDAVKALHRARAIEPRLSDVNDLLKRIARPVYEEGRRLQKQGHREAAFEQFDEALGIYPKNAWARRRAEETRFADSSWR
jgi:tetratricopeptide (TPR) repeat protein